MFSKLTINDFFSNPFIAVMIFLIITTILFIGLDRRGAFEKFLKFGPDEEAHFLKVKLDTWPKVIVLYIISFVTALLAKYFNSIVARGFITARLLNPAVDEMNATKSQSLMIIYLYPICVWLLNIIMFFVTLTMQLQFLLPNLLGNMIVQYWYFLPALESKKKFKK